MGLPAPELAIKLLEEKSLARAAFVEQLGQIVETHNMAIGAMEGFERRAKSLYGGDAMLLDLSPTLTGETLEHWFMRVVYTPPAEQGGGEVVEFWPLATFIGHQPDLEGGNEISAETGTSVVVHPSGLLYELGDRRGYINSSNLVPTNGPGSVRHRQYKLVPGLDSSIYTNGKPVVLKDGSKVSFEPISVEVGSQIDVWKRVGQGLKNAIEGTDYLPDLVA